MNIHPKAHARVALNSLQNNLGYHVPEHDAPILTGRGDKRGTVQDTKTATDSKLFIKVALVRLLDATGNIVPQANAVVEVKSQDEAAIGGETDVGYGWVVFVNKCTEALAC
jgi:hypothetical protein